MLLARVYKDHYSTERISKCPKPLELIEESVAYCMKEHLQKIMSIAKAEFWQYVYFTVRIGDDSLKIECEKNHETILDVMKDCYVVKNLAFKKYFNGSPVVIIPPDYSKSSYRDQKRDAAILQMHHINTDTTIQLA